MQYFSSLLPDKRGSVAIITALSLTLLVSVGGVAIDFGRQQLVKLRAQQAATAAAIAVAAMPGTKPDGTPYTQSDKQQTFARYFSMNYPDNYLGVPISPGSVTISDTAVSLDLTTGMPTIFLKSIGVASLPINLSIQVLAASSSSQSDYDLVVLFDETYSTTGVVGNGDNSIRITDMRAAVNNMANSVLTDVSNSKVRMGFVGYSSHITSKWGLSNKLADATTAINQFRPTCNNYDHVGLQAAQNMLQGGTAGEANGVVTTYPWLYGYDCTVAVNPTTPVPRTLRSDGNSMSTVKNLVIVTDGDIMTDPWPCYDPFRYTDSFCGYGGYGGLYPTQFKAQCGQNCYALPQYRPLNLFSDACTALKNATGAHVFVVVFASPPAGATTAMQQCASTNVSTGQPDFYYAANVTALNNYLTNITSYVKKIKIVK